jgi:hypothetical protein
MMTLLTCALCGASWDVGADEQRALTALAWVHSVERGQELDYCPACSRKNLRSIEGKLDVDFW